MRYEDPKMAKTIRAMICERFQSRTELLASITETRGVDGVVQLYRDGAIWIPDDTVALGNLELGSYAHPLPAGLTTTGDLHGLGSYAHPLPAGLKRR